MAGLTIGAVAMQAGVRPSALRYYEQVGLVAPAWRASGQRRYDPSVLDRLALIAYAKHVGFTIAETKLLLAGFAADVPPSARWRALATRKQQELDAIITRARQMKRLLNAVLACQCMGLDECGRRIRAGSRRTTRGTSRVASLTRSNTRTRARR
jgi:MerR family transcriptional regulator, redox-sensitive transcriptional activator SoxR